MVSRCGIAAGIRYKITASLNIINWFIFKDYHTDNVVALGTQALQNNTVNTKQ